MTKKKDLGILSDFEEMIPEENMDNSSFSFITEFKGNYEEELRDVNIPDELPILPLRNMVLFPTTVLPISVGRESSLQLIKDLEKSGGYMGVMCQKEPEVNLQLKPFLIELIRLNFY